MHPLMGGSEVKHSATVFFRAAPSVTSHAGAATLTPMDSSSVTSSLLESCTGPRLESRMRFLTPREAIHRAMDLPSPPKAPTITYDAAESNWEVGFLLGTTETRSSS